MPPGLELLILAVPSAAFAVRRGWSGAPADAGAVVMSLGIVSLGALALVPSGGRALSRLVTLEALLLWIAFATSYLLRCRQPALRGVLRDPLGRFAAGAWVAGSAVVAQAIARTIPAWRPLALVMTWVALLIWIGFLPHALRGFVRLSAARERTTGLVLLATVATQSLVLAGRALPGTGLANETTTIALVTLGCALYAWGLGLVLRHWARAGWRRLIADWDPPNCIVHGAASISGFAALAGGLSAGLVAAIWIWAGIALLAVEVIDTIQAARRLRDLIRRRARLSHRAAQWARVFTFGMFYAFSAAVLASPAATRAMTALGLHGVLAAVVGSGQYLVIALTAAQAFRFVAAPPQAPE